MSYALGVFRCSHDLKSAGQCRGSILIIAARRSDLSQFRGVSFPNLFPNPAAGGPLSRRSIRLSPASRTGPEGRRTSPTRWCAERSPLMPQHGRRAGVRHVSSYAIQRWSLAQIREHFSREQIDLLIALFSEKETYDDPRESVYCRPVEFAARRSRRRSTEARPHRPTRSRLANAV